MHRINGSVDSQDRSSNRPKEGKTASNIVQVNSFLYPRSTSSSQSLHALRVLWLGQMCSGRRASRCVLKPIANNGGKIYVNGRSQAAPTKDWKLVICGIDASRI